MKRLLLAAILVGLAATPTLVAQAQTAPDMGRITGEVVLGTAGATLGDDLAVDFIVLAGSEVGGTLPATLDGATFSLDIPVGDGRRYLARIVYQGVSYLGAPVEVTAATREAVAAVPPVFETTAETPNLTISETVLTAVALDRDTGEIGLIREDLVQNPTDRVFTGGENAVTLRLPTPERTTDAMGENPDGRFALEDGILTTTTPIRALGSTSIVTRYLVTYDVSGDEYVLRVTTPVAADRIVVRIPADYMRDAEVLSAGAEGAGEVFEIEGREGVPLRTFVLENAGPGDSLVVRFEGLAIQRNHNPIAETPGSMIAGAVALLVIGAAGVFAVRRGKAPAA